MLPLSALLNLSSSPWQNLRRATPAERADVEHLYEYHPPVWITDTTLRKSPFVPQMGDEVRVIKFENMNMEHRNNITVRFLFLNVRFPFVGDIFSTGS